MCYMNLNYITICLEQIKEYEIVLFKEKHTGFYEPPRPFEVNKVKNLNIALSVCGQFGVLKLSDLLILSIH